MIEETIIFFLRTILDIFFVTTGEIVLYIFTLGKHKPRFDLYTKSKPWKFVFFSDISGIIGMISWFAILILLIKIYRSIM